MYFAGTLYWTGTVVAQFGGLASPVAMLAMLLLALYLALYPAFAGLMVSRAVARFGPAALWLMPAAWVSTEYLRGRLFGGFPWVPLGNSQVDLTSVAQLASVTGVYGLSALVALINAGIAVALMVAGGARRRAITVLVVVMATVVAGGAWRVADARLTREGELLTVGLIQGNIAQEDKWDPRQAPRIVSAYERLTREAVARGAEYVVWPESSTPFMFEEDPVGEAAVRSLVREVGVPLLIGSEKLEVTDRPRLYNAAFMLDADGSTSAVYRKIQLVPFGEFVPFKSWLTFVSPLVERMTDFAPGDTVTPLPVGDATVTTAICYEVVYPALAREAVRAGSQLLTTITNDAWYGHSSAPYQHFSLARMRAIEEGRYLVRAAQHRHLGYRRSVRSRHDCHGTVRGSSSGGRREAAAGTDAVRAPR